ncbi:ubiquitin carboxyl-terminal hydrolase [Helicosporidium sp. ATCC 50920]|nr:ubiquitin carboxyl-terminal hydrolase [Helicosporidium sp. ATCC 50920]|eukprot:KDD75219.1 ubiquitin carboxyl-terminal hydrolase [Helicosporidium sp. ATCC 50920]
MTVYWSVGALCGCVGYYNLLAETTASFPALQTRGGAALAALALIAIIFLKVALYWSARRMDRPLSLASLIVFPLANALFEGCILLFAFDAGRWLLAEKDWNVTPWSIGFRALDEISTDDRRMWREFLLGFGPSMLVFIAAYAALWEDYMLPLHVDLETPNKFVKAMVLVHFASLGTYWVAGDVATFMALKWLNEVGTVVARSREESEGEAEAGAGRRDSAADAEARLDSEDDDAPLFTTSKASKAVRSGAECPYLDTISRKNLDFDFEKCCSVSLSPVNVYACLVCGKYFQGRAPSTHAFTHSLEAGHHVFMKLADGRVYCLPDGYEVRDRSLIDIQRVLDPCFSIEAVEGLDREVRWARTLEGGEYMPGLVGLNNMRANDYANAVIQCLVRARPIRDFFLRPENYATCSSRLVRRFGELVRKVWMPAAFKGHVSPHEFMQAVQESSDKRFLIEKPADCAAFFSWLLNALHCDLVKGRRKQPSVITQTFQGELLVTTEAGTGKAAKMSQNLEEKTSFLMLALQLPPTPLFKDALEKVIIPQVSIFELLAKFNGETVTDDIKLGRRTFRLTRLPPYLIVHVARFSRNQFFLEKNPTLVSFPIKHLDLSLVCPVPPSQPCTYSLVANLIHEGRAEEGSCLAHIHRKVENAWFEVQDLRTTEVLPQIVELSQTYMQVYERTDKGGVA